MGSNCVCLKSHKESAQILLTQENSKLPQKEASALHEALFETPGSTVNLVNLQSAARGYYSRKRISETTLKEILPIEEVIEEPSSHLTEAPCVKNGKDFQKYEDGSFYEGMFKDGLRQGYGKLYWPNQELSLIHI